MHTISKILKRGLLLTILLLSAAIPCHSESDSVDSLMRFAGNIHQFNEIFPQEKVFLQFDNTSYYTGETIWFKAFVTSATTLSRAQSKILYVDLISPTGVLLKQQKLMIVAGQADGSFPLLDGSTAQAREKRGVISYPSGFYEIRAYTSFMLNFDQDIIFSRVFAVYEKPDIDGDYYESNPTIKIRRSDTNEPRPKTENMRDINASFYPEGGHLIIGKPCHVAFKVTDETGFGIDAQGTLEDSGITFSTVHDGMGEFTFTPQERRNQVRITAGGNTRTFQLPQAETSGYAIHVEPCGTDSILVKTDGTADMGGKVLGVTLTCRGELMDFGTIDTGSGESERIISTYGVPEGVCRIHVFDKDGTLYASRSVYHHSQVTKSPMLDVTTDKDTYGPFEKVTMDFSLEDGSGNPFRDRFCLAVRDSRSQGNAFADDLKTSMLLSSDLKGLIETPSWYFDSDSPQREYALDLLCMVQGWERYDWNVMTGQKEFTEKHRMEENLTVNGWIMNSSGKKPVGNVEVTAALVPQDKKLTETYSYKTDSTGYFGFDIGVDFYDRARFTINAHADKERLIGPSARIVFDRSMIPGIRAYKPEELVFGSVQNNKRKAEKKQTAPEDDALPTVIKAETGYILRDLDITEERMYIDYFTFDAFDVVKDVELELDKGEYSTDLWGYLLEKGYEVFQNDSGILVNGFEPFFYVHDSKKFLDQGIFENPTSIDSKDIRSIIIYDRPMFLMNILTQCPLYQTQLNKRIQIIPTDSLYERFLLIDVLAKEEHERSTRDELFNINRRITTVDGFSRPYEFYSPQYPDGPIPGDVDYRRTLYWNPNVITDEEGHAKVEFYNSSITKHFNVEAAGITSSGIPYTLDAGF